MLLTVEALDLVVTALSPGAGCGSSTGENLYPVRLDAQGFQSEILASVVGA
jgi:hypothetical protein